MSSHIQQSPIIVIDSGLGGLTVVRALRAALPHERIVYFGDTARLPYGSKTASTVATFVRQIIAYLSPLAPKHVVIACNTATALALPEVRKAFPQFTITGVIEPGARAAAIAAGAKVTPIIGIIATEATVKSKAYERAIHRRRSLARMLLRPAPLLVPIIEEGRASGDPLVRLALRQYLQPLVQRGLDVLVLGCTHYPILTDELQAIVGDSVKVIDSAEQCAVDVASRLAARGLLATVSVVGQDLECYVTDDPDRFARLGSRFLGVPIEKPSLVSPDDLYGVMTTPPTVRVAG